ncbi:hypothetical protein PsYK624_060800 [Phanerochaete sordida]|uniref:Uncharacterized protein n=1 Tax=Phanerochaete sordida TaxID=48140 RepID=A0A9P3LCV4_9APHY|nr:hypothetical protein PsYK624_060800 [Phanerochaete sordida]
MQMFLESLVRPADFAGAQCARAARCRIAVQRLALAAAEGHLFAAPFPLDTTHDWLEGRYAQSPESRPCQTCHQALLETIDGRTEATWRKLGEIFGVAPGPTDSRDSETRFKLFRGTSSSVFTGSADKEEESEDESGSAG